MWSICMRGPYACGLYVSRHLDVVVGEVEQPYEWLDACGLGDRRAGLVIIVGQLGKRGRRLLLRVDPGVIRPLGH